jgi:transposase
VAIDLVLDVFHAAGEVMNRDRKEIDKIIRKVTANRMTREAAARALRVSLRTIHNYSKRYFDYGPDGLIDHRCGHFRKIKPEQEARIVACKLDRPRCSARWIRDRLKLNVSVEAVRLVLFKHRLNRANLGPVSKFATGTSGWQPF